MLLKSPFEQDATLSYYCFLRLLFHSMAAEEAQLQHSWLDGLFPVTRSATGANSFGLDEILAYFRLTGRHWSFSLVFTIMIYIALDSSVSTSFVSWLALVEVLFKHFSRLSYVLESLLSIIASV